MAYIPSVSATGLNHMYMSAHTMLMIAHENVHQKKLRLRESLSYSFSLCY